MLGSFLSCCYNYYSYFSSRERSSNIKKDTADRQVGHFFKSRMTSQLLLCFLNHGQHVLYLGVHLQIYYFSRQHTVCHEATSLSSTLSLSSHQLYHQAQQCLLQHAGNANILAVFRDPLTIRGSGARMSHMRKIQSVKMLWKT